MHCLTWLSGEIPQALPTKAPFIGLKDQLLFITVDLEMIHEVRTAHAYILPTHSLRNQLFAALEW